ncbi:DUF3540 domain-containing protein [uncultured Roseibium sp.]|uniref:DUF3540 domain-containing protein n=1 Tax=uncultured Roseibium sp. TaxID=1936171 RepID=UPI0026086031|nr:DUF3540 domain-containing protein [uncultured Roseibium sp.]
MTNKKHPQTEKPVKHDGAVQPDVAGLETGEVVALATAQEAMVTLATGEQIHAIQATSCLLAPVIGDAVLVYRGPEQAFLLSVLARKASVVAEVSVPGAKDIALKAKGKLALSAPDINVSTRRMHVIADTITQTGKQLVNNFSRAFETCVDKILNARTVTTTAQSRSSAIKETETLKAGILVQNIDGVATQNSDISMITAEEDVRLDAKRVSVG